MHFEHSNIDRLLFLGECQFDIKRVRQKPSKILKEQIVKVNGKSDTSIGRIHKNESFRAFETFIRIYWKGSVVRKRRYERVSWVCEGNAIIYFDSGGTRFGGGCSWVTSLEAWKIRTRGVPQRRNFTASSCWRENKCVTVG